jgi:hypothetical protein
MEVAFDGEISEQLVYIYQENFGQVLVNNTFVVGEIVEFPTPICRRK